MILENHKVVAEMNIIFLGKHYSNDQLPPSMLDELAIAINSIKKVKGIKIMVTGTSIQMEADSIQDILKAIEYAHLSLQGIGIPRIISSIRIDETYGRSEKVEEKVD
ncbi:thiamine-binding protein [Candidatus Nitrosocosmicus sp. T]